MCEFEKNVLKGLLNCGLNFDETGNLKLGIAVSGGADSVSLLLALSNLVSEKNISLYVITVNHNIRSEEESSGDANFVIELCNQLKKQGKNILYKTVEYERGLVNETAKCRGHGIEDAARYLRYKSFEEFITENKLDYLCLAHNKNDNLETLLMRFLQGSGIESSGGIASSRGKYIRPLLNIERYDIEKYLVDNNITWRTDSTNFDTDYLRNKIRHKLIPFLDDEFEGWKKAVLAGGKKSSEQNEVIESILEAIPYNFTDGIVSFEKANFITLYKALQIRFLIKCINAIGNDSRIPYVFIEDVVASIMRNTSKNFEKRFDEVLIEIKKDNVFIKKIQKSQTDLVFFAIMEESGKNLFPFGELNVSIGKNNNSACVAINGTTILKDIAFPFCVRNIQLDDEVECADGTMKKLADVLSDWQVNEEIKSQIPVIQSVCEVGQPIKAVIGSIFGYKDWVIK